MLFYEGTKSIKIELYFNFNNQLYFYFYIKIYYMIYGYNKKDKLIIKIINFII